MQDKHYPEYISERIFLVHSWKLAPFSGEDHEKYYNVRVWLDAYQDSDLEDITRVTYRLYDDFSQKVIATESKKKNFEILLTIWGEFTVVAYVEREGKSPLLLTRYLDVPGSFESVHRPSEGEEPKSYIV